MVAEGLVLWVSVLGVGFLVNQLGSIKIATVDACEKATVRPVGCDEFGMLHLDLPLGDAAHLWFRQLLRKFRQSVLDKNLGASFGTVDAGVYPSRLQEAVTHNGVAAPMGEVNDLSLGRLVRNDFKQRRPTLLTPLCLSEWVSDLHSPSANACADDFGA
jgi:hypothetical protein